MKQCCEKYLNEQFAGDADVIGEIYREYAASCVEKLSEAKAALAACDWALLDRVAHTIKGNAMATGDNDMMNNGIELRKKSALQDVSGATELIAKMEDLAAGL